MAVALKRRGLEPVVHASRAGPYFLDSARSDENRRVMRMAQKQFRQQAEELGVATHLTPVSESVLMRAFDAGRVAIVLVSGYHMIPRGRPHWVFAFGRDGHRVLVHDPSAIKDEQGMMPATYAVPWSAFERMMRLGREPFSVAIVIGKGR
jgi:hypothetical protein